MRNVIASLLSDNVGIIERKSAAQLETQELSDCAVSIAPPSQVQRENSSTSQPLQVSQLEQGVVL